MNNPGKSTKAINRGFVKGPYRIGGLQLSDNLSCIRLERGEDYWPVLGVFKHNLIKHMIQQRSISMDGYQNVSKCMLGWTEEMLSPPRQIEEHG